MCYFVVWSPSEAVCVEITGDQSFFEEYLSTIDAFVAHFLLEVQYFTMGAIESLETVLVQITF